MLYLLLNISRLELQNELREKGVPIRGLSKENVIAEVEAMKNILPRSTY